MRVSFTMGTHPSPTPLSTAVWIICVLELLTTLSHSEHCTYDYSDVEIYCDCSHPNVTSLEKLAVIHPFMCAPHPVNRSLTLVHLNDLRQVTDKSSKLSPTLCDLVSVVNLTLYSSGVSQLAPNSFDLFPVLTRLNMSGNAKLNDYGDGAFESIGDHLTHLVLRSNPVRSLKTGYFRGLTSLLVLDLSHNLIAHAESGTFSQDCCSNIRELRLDNNSLTVLDAKTLVGLSSLKLLDLRRNPLQHIDGNAFQFASTLTELYMSHNEKAPFGRLNNLTDGLISHLGKLAILRIEGFKIQNLTTKSFQGLHSLRVLSLRGNRLVQLPSDIFSPMSRLEYLDLSSNRLVCISSSLNPEIHQDFLAGLGLRWIDLSWNRLTHLNHLTARSLSLFDPPPGDGSKLVLNITGNPWQYIDEDTFCNPQNSDFIRPTQLIVGPLPNSSYPTWRTSLGLWYARVLWPQGPFALVGQNSHIFGLEFGDGNSERQSVVDEGVKQQLGFSFALSGAADSRRRCQEFTNGYLDGSSNNKTAGLRDILRVKLPSATLIAYSISSYCPRLSIRHLEDHELMDLDVPYMFTSHDPFISLTVTEKGSRLYLLIIIGICITFLLIALTAIMCYRAWSRHTSDKCLQNGELADYGASAEKQVLLRYPEMAVSPNRPANLLLYSGNDVSNTTLPLLVRGTNAVSVDEEYKSCDTVICTSSSLDTSSVKSALPSRTRHLRLSRPKSDSEAHTLDEPPKLTAFGIV